MAVVAPKGDNLTGVGRALDLALVVLGSAVRGSLSKEDAAFICVAALDSVPEVGFIFEVINGEKKVSDWNQLFKDLMENAGRRLE
ncbi:hypothetical protein Ancab_012596 [Ancistrocladus abbreviatus]